MRQEEQDRLKRFLQAAVPPLEDPGLRRDLWPAMLRKIETGNRRVFWLDWVLAALLAGWAFLFPEAVLHLLYHL
jgi:hypothetical protein